MQVLDASVVMNPAVDDAGLISDVLGIRSQQVSATIDLLDGGASIPFIACYRRERTGGLDAVQLRLVQEQLFALRRLAVRREALRGHLAGLGMLDAQWLAEIAAADSLQRIADLELLLKPADGPVIRSRALGLDALADAVMADPRIDPLVLARDFVAGLAHRNPAQMIDLVEALQGARAILIDRFTRRTDVRNVMRERLWMDGRVRVTRTLGAHPDADKYRDYFDYAEPLASLPSHRALALFRGRHQGILALDLEPGCNAVNDGRVHPLVMQLAEMVGLGQAVRNHVSGGQPARPGDAWLVELVKACWENSLRVQLEADLFARIRQSAEAEAIRVFGANLRDLLLAPPAGRRPVIGLDPGHRSGVRVAVVDADGKPVEALILHPNTPRRDRSTAIATLAALAERHRVKLVAIGNGAASRDTDRLAGDLIDRHPGLGLRKVLVSEAGASVYAQSELAARELPGLDDNLRGAVSIARRLQDPLAELVKIDPRSIGVGQYQHDVDQGALALTLESVVEDCVNAVGVDPNTASAQLLSRVAGIGPELARHIVAHRDRHGRYESRTCLLRVTGMTDKAFEQAAGFLRIRDAADPLDAASVHPEAYPVVRKIAMRLGVGVGALIGNRERLRRLRPGDFAGSGLGEATVREVIAQLERSGQDPRGEFVTPTFREGVERIDDLRVGMRLQGVVTNVANFGAFVDVGVCQDGMIHLSELSDRFVRDPRDIVRVGQVVEVTVIMADVQRRRIGLSLRSEPGRGSGLVVPVMADGVTARHGSPSRPGASALSRETD